MSAPEPIELQDAVRLAELFRLLGDPTRTRILYALRDADELCVSDLAERIGITESTMSHALRLLRTAGVVKNHRVGRTVFYSLDDDHVRALLDVAHEHLQHD